MVGNLQNESLEIFPVAKPIRNCDEREIRFNQDMNSKKFKNDIRFPRITKLSTYFNKRYQSERQMEVKPSESKALNAWNRAWLILAVQKHEQSGDEKTKQNTDGTTAISSEARRNKIVDSSMEMKSALGQNHFMSAVGEQFSDLTNLQSSKNSADSPVTVSPVTISTNVSTVKRTPFFRPFECDASIEDIDQSTISPERKLTTHTQTNYDEKPLACEICDRRFARPDHLTKHMRAHVNFPYQCKNCNQGFSIQQSHEIHEQNCNQLRYGCGTCDYSTINITHFVTHLRRHAGVKPFQCDHCRKRFLQKAHANLHMKRCHSQC